MRKIITVMNAIVFAVVMLPGKVFAETQLPPKALEIRVFLPAATGFTCAWSRVYDLNPDPDVYDLEFVPTPDTGVLNFDDLSDDLVTGVFNTDYYYVCDIQVEGGVVDKPSLDFTYLEGDNPNTDSGYSGKGLGYKAVMTVAAVDGNDPNIFTDDTETNLVKVRINQSESVHIPALGNFIVGQAPDVEYHWPRIGIGLSFGDDLVTGKYNILGTSTGLLPAEPFTNADRSGDFTGILTVTMTTDSVEP